VAMIARESRRRDLLETEAAQRGLGMAPQKRRGSRRARQAQPAEFGVGLAKTASSHLPKKPVRREEHAFAAQLLQFRRRKRSTWARSRPGERRGFLGCAPRDRF